MKFPENLVFLGSNVKTFIISLVTSWISFSALATLSDDPFIYGTWPDVVAAASIQKALSLIIGEIVRDFTFEVYKIAIPCAFIISWRTVQGRLKGIAKERQTWTPWYRQQEHAIAEGEMLGESPVTSEHKRTDAYFRSTQSILSHLRRCLIRFVVHFSCWYSAFALLAIIMQPGNGIRETAAYLVNSFPDFAIIAGIHAFLSSYQETLSRIKGAAKERQVWTQWCDMQLKWHQRQQGAKVHGYTLAEAPPPPPLNADQLP